jgi:hypothetical protein
MGSGQKQHEDQVGTEWVAVRGYPNTLVRKQRGLGEYEGPARMRKPPFWSLYCTA